MFNIFSTKNERLLKVYYKKLIFINALAQKYGSCNDDELKSEFGKLKEKVTSGTSFADVLNDAFAIAREASKRSIGLYPFDVQMIGALVLFEGKVAEMKTGEGKTLSAAIAITLSAMDGKGVHLITANSYLANRDANDMRPLYEFLGYSVGVVKEDMSDEEKFEAYDSDVTYGTNSDFGFDYLRDNLKFYSDRKYQRGHHYAIIDEVDSILIDEARTPLIISGPLSQKMDNYVRSNNVALKFIKETDFSVDEKNKTINVTPEGLSKAEKLFGVDNLYSLENSQLAHYLEQSLRANNLFTKDVDYIVDQGEVKIIDEFTGRIGEGRRFGEGLHQALEAKENVKINEESQTLASITYQNYFRMYDKLAGMTGTAQTEASEFLEIYKLDVITIPTNLPIRRIDHPDLVYKNEKDKIKSIVKEVKRLNEIKAPVLIGTSSIEKSELFSLSLKKEGIKHTVLNAKQHEREGEIIKEAGSIGAVTIATNMAGRGVDIKLTDEVKELGGLHIIGTERHENRRIDNQLRGRSGRQGDIGNSQFYLSLEDNLLRIFGGDKIKNIIGKLGMKDGEHIESKILSRVIENSQKKVEAMHFESRKHLVEFDDVSNNQRKVIFKLRDDIISDDYDLMGKIGSIRQELVHNMVERVYVENNSKDGFYNDLISNVKDMFNSNMSVSDLKNCDNEVEYAKEITLSYLVKEFENKVSFIDDEDKVGLFKEMYLSVLDNDWRVHLHQMDLLKSGINLRGYNQKEPIVEYKKDGYMLFMELIETIKHDYIELLHKVQFDVENIDNDMQALNDSFKENEEEVERAIKSSIYTQQSVDVDDKKISRNDLCPCGSGLKYKKCCGKK